MSFLCIVNVLSSVKKKKHFQIKIHEWVQILSMRREMSYAMVPNLARNGHKLTFTPPLISLK